MTEDTTTRKPLRNTRENEKYKAYITMNELFKEAEKLYKEIDSIQMIWVASTKDNDEKGKRHAIGRMSIAMCNAMQLLKCFIERKGNIVDLSEVWHDVAKKPDRGEGILIDTDTLGYDVITAKWHSDERWASFASLYVIKRWAYVKDLLPKGGE